MVKSTRNSPHHIMVKSTCNSPLPRAYGTRYPAGS